MQLDISKASHHAKSARWMPELWYKCQGHSDGTNAKARAEQCHQCLTLTTIPE
jgi:hypothetical protein